MIFLWGDPWGIKRKVHSINHHTVKRVGALETRNPNAFISNALTGLPTCLIRSASGPLHFLNGRQRQQVATMADAQQRQARRG
jgi:hypothetical protein